MRTCEVDGCNSKHYGKGYCHKHYLQVWTHGKLTGDKPSYKGKDIKCNVAWCTNPAYCKDLCTKHYNQTQRYGRVLDVEIPTVHCTVHGCENLRFSKKLCQKHYYHHHTNGFIPSRTKMDPNEVVVNGDCALIKLYDQNCKHVASAVIDSEDVERCKGFRWGMSGAGYVYGSNSDERILLHRLLLPGNDITDHINGNPLDNRKMNLRKVTPQQNAMNARVQSNSTTGIKGVYIYSGDRFLAEIISNNKKIRLGVFDSITDAADARKRAALKYHGEFAFEARPTVNAIEE